MKTESSKKPFNDSLNINLYESPKIEIIEMEMEGSIIMSSGALDGFGDGGYQGF